MSLNAHAVSVAVLDSGVDIYHPAIKDQLRENRFEFRNGKDDDANGLVDDIYGWNFADNHEDLLDPALRAQWPNRAYQYYWVRMKRSFGTWTSAEENWYQASREDKEFMKVRSDFSSYVHGTHVAAIALNGPLTVPTSDRDLPIPSQFQVKEATQSFKLLPIRYLGDYDYFPWRKPSTDSVSQSDDLTFRKARFEEFLASYYDWQFGKLKMALDYATGFEDVRVINGSFGLSYDATVDMIDDFLSDYYLKEETLDPSKIATDFLSRLNTGLRKYAKTRPRVLFTFSAGNSDENTDQALHFPSGAIGDNVLSVGASLGFKERAYFSNYGIESVDLLAPGLAILSSVSPSTEIPINGTSQASPFMAHLALELFAINENVDASLIKNIMMNTVDYKASLKDRCSSSGIVNPTRAKRAIALFSAGETLQSALSMARAEVKDADASVEKTLIKPEIIDPLPNPFAP